jgi:hypothetical protein
MILRFEFSARTTGNPYRSHIGSHETGRRRGEHPLIAVGKGASVRRGRDRQNLHYTGAISRSQLSDESCLPVGNINLNHATGQFAGSKSQDRVVIS